MAPMPAPISTAPLASRPTLGSVGRAIVLSAMKLAIAPGIIDSTVPAGS